MCFCLPVDECRCNTQMFKGVVLLIYTCVHVYCICRPVFCIFFMYFPFNVLLMGNIAGVVMLTCRCVQVLLTRKCV